MIRLSELAAQIGGRLEGDGDILIRGVGGIHSAGTGEISFLANPRYEAEAAVTGASAVIVSEDWNRECPAALIRVKNPDKAFARAAMLFYTPPPRPVPGVHPSAVVAEDAELGEGVSVGPLCVVEAGVKIGAGTVLMANCCIGYGSVIGTGGLLYPHVSIREFVRIGDRAILHNGTVIGSDGFGYSVDRNGVRTKIPQIGTVEIGNDVEIGANTTIDRARFGKTAIGNGVKIDNLVQIGHNVVIGDHAVIISQVGIAGSTSVGERTILAGQAGISGHLKIGSGVIVGPQSGVTKDLPDGAYVMGGPAMPVAKMKRSHAEIMLIPKLRERVRKLEEKIRKIEGN
ncbi:MAG: UDP-3-O-[3-hydroxymyristoyl] glucosamine N-acyltransferase [Verrucomicrobiota bacterium]|jgi:UDP-3-O-[3-hydroxymyristoyl] glucosamine N-acyltransferase|nr:UDP-3-O-[3-hydroxymyristoyl] glucosamine N-acyltransferase [Verrucomicrobiota bacterium]MDK2963083.1 UDP-3-O-[3-hydroxymyristoyl] glucosamine N-acyltransferase [Verrucomicrobiota bacterium]